VLRAATTGGRELLTGDRRGVEPGAVADLVVVPVTNTAEAVVLVPQRRAVVKRGVVSRAAGLPGPPPGPPER
jgi:cytosine/adenosine deaminase-related metal-dependent hydrolase